jgi:hypothetical protein
VLEVTKEEILHFLYMKKSEKIGLRKKYYNILHNKESEEYKRFISVYLNHKSMLTEREQR